MPIDLLWEVFMNLRRFHRKSLSGTVVEMTDGIERFEGEVKNVSRTGIEVLLDADLADSDTEKYVLRLSHDDQTFRISAIPRWQKRDSRGSRVGMRICEAPRNWFTIDD